MYYTSQCLIICSCSNSRRFLNSFSYHFFSYRLFCSSSPLPSLPLLHPHSTQMSLEDSFVNYALSTGQDSVILCDRGVMDGQAYVAEDTWRTVLQVRTYVRVLDVILDFFFIFEMLIPSVKSLLG